MRVDCDSQLEEEHLRVQILQEQDTNIPSEHTVCLQASLPRVDGDVHRPENVYNSPKVRKLELESLLGLSKKDLAMHTKVNFEVFM
jgi:hypothetical protein